MNLRFRLYEVERNPSTIKQARSNMNTGAEVYNKDPEREWPYPKHRKD